MNTKVSRYGLVFVDDRNDLKFKQLYDVLFQLQREMMQIANRAVQIYWEDSNYSNKVKSETGAFPTKDELLGRYGCSTQNYVYRCTSKEFYKNNTANVTTILQNVGKRYKQNSKDCFVGKRSIDSYKSTIPIYLGKSSLKLFKDGTDYFVTLSLLSNKFKKEVGTKNGLITFRLNFGKSWSSRQIIDDILSGVSSHTSSSLVYKKNKWMLNLGYNYKEETRIDWIEGRTMGVDLGVAKPVVFAFNDNEVHGMIDENEIASFRNQMIARRKSYGRQTKHCADSKIGHGVHKRVESIERLKDKEAKFRDRINHQYSRMLVDTAVKYKCKTIQIEDLSGISAEDTFLKSWPYFDLQNKITYKAAEKGINVVKINPKFTSQRCSKCGYISKENRQTQADFLCKKCGFGLNADWNAAKNISIPGIGDIIKSTLIN